ncbi:MAG: hypothetical protein AB8F95_09180 [Bacteroidia bacterium]
MKYVEYMWLGWALVLVVFLASRFGSLEWFQYIIAFLGIVVSTFMFTFRRNLRLQVDRRLAEEEEEDYDDEEEMEDEDESIVH